MLTYNHKQKFLSIRIVAIFTGYLLVTLELNIKKADWENLLNIEIVLDELSVLHISEVEEKNLAFAVSS